ncbi:MAG: carboxypeptidase regulatory-like domain-containing protein, partial [Anaerolineae bacterium]|nr:carboxypeptidase regulatory-like domain-containing protein [Anaerolineae bacterium]
MNKHSSFSHRLIQLFITTLLIIGIAFQVFPAYPVAAAGGLTVTPITWNVVGLDSNNVNVGPNNFPVGVEVCNDTGSPVNNVQSYFYWDSSDPYINLRSGSLSSFTGSHAKDSLGVGECYDFYYEVSITRSSAAYNHTRRYHITATSNETGATVYSSPIPREIFVEHLVSQNRNGTTSVDYKEESAGSYTNVPNGGTMTLYIGGTYDIKLTGFTATQGYNQLESFINIPNTVFQVNSVTSTYSSGTSPTETLYADACGWDNDPLSPTYRSCIVSDNKSGGNTVTNTYNITIISSSASSSSLTTLLYDFSGSSYHYNADFTSSGRTVSIVDAVGSLQFSKSFSPAILTAGASTTLTFTIHNPTAGSISNVNFTDNLPTSPGAMKVAGTPNASTSGCGVSPTWAPLANDTTLSFANGSIAAGGTCTISVDVTTAATPTSGTYNNTTNNLFANGVDSGLTASASVTLSQTGTGGTTCTNTATLAKWTFPSTAFTSPGSLSAPTQDTSPKLVTGTASVAGSVAGVTSSTTDSNTSDGSYAWVTDHWPNSGAPNATNYLLFTVPQTGTPYDEVSINFSYKLGSSWANPTTLYVDYNNNGGSYTSLSSFSITDVVYHNTGTLKATTTGSSSSAFRINLTRSPNNNGQVFIDDVTITACTQYGSPLPPTLQKNFSPSAVAVNQVDSTLTFSIGNPNGSNLTGVNFTDTLPDGLLIGTSTTASLNGSGCTGTLTATAGTTTISLTNATIPSTDCTITVPVKATAEGTYTNLSGYISSTEGGTNTNNYDDATSPGRGMSTLTALLPPSISKLFPTPILAGGTSTLTFNIVNPNTSTALTGVAFSDTFPTSPGAMTVVNPAVYSTTNCGSPSYTPVAGAGSISFSGGTIPAGGTCKVTVNVTAPTAGTYANTTGSVSSTNGGTGNTASANLLVNPATPSLSLQKQISTSSSGPWSKYITVSGGTPIYYQFTVENTGNVALTSISVSDANISTSGCSFTTPLAAGDTTTCVVGPITSQSTLGTYTNSATAQGSYSSTPYTSSPSTASYALPAPELSVYKMNDTSGSLLTGGTFNWTLTARNSKYATAASFADGETILLDTLPAGPTYGSVSYTAGAIAPTGTINCSITVGVLTCKASGAVTLGAGASFDASFSVTPSSATDLSNTAIIDPGNLISESNENNNSYTDAVSVNSPSTPDLRIAKSNNVSGLSSTGDNFTWFLTASNSGTAAATFSSGQTILTDTLPVNATYSNLSVGALTNVSGNVACSISSGTLTCSASGGSVVMDSSSSFTVSFTATPTATGNLINSATIDPNGNISESNETNNTASDTVSVAGSFSAELGITKTDGVSTVGYNGVVNYTITVSNHGPNSANGAIFKDALATGINVTGVTCGSAAGGAACPSGANTTVSLMQGSGIVIPTLPNGGSVVFTVTASITASSGTVTNTATIDPPAGVTDPGGWAYPNSATDVDTLTSLPELAITKSNNTSGNGVIGTPFTWTITVTNTGTADATFTDGWKIITDTLPANATYGTPTVSGTPVNITNSANISCSITTGVLTCSASGADVTVGADTGSFSVSFTATPTASGTLSNTAAVDPDTHITESNESNNSSTADVVVVSAVASPDLTISKTNDTSDAGVLGTAFTWTITVNNTGTAAATFTDGWKIITDTLPANATYGTPTVGGTPVNITNSGNISCSIATGVLTCSASGAAVTVGAGTGSFNVSFTATPQATGDLANTATVDPDTHITESSESNNTAATNTVTVAAPNLTISKTNNTSGNAVVGTPFTWTITVSNNGNSAAVFASGQRIVTDTLPSGPTYGTPSTNVSGITGTVSCSIVSTTLDCTASGGSVTIGASQSFTISYSVTPATTTSLSNSAVVDPDGQITESNEDSDDNSTSNTVTVSAASGTISGTVRLDNNGDGTIQGGETGVVSGVTVTLTGTDSHGNPVSMTTTTNGSGQYSFSGVPAGSYTITETDPSGYGSTGDTQGTNDNKINLTLTSGQTSINNDFLDAQLGSISGQVRNDVDADGDLSDTENGLAGAVIELRSSSCTAGVNCPTVTTTSSGTFTFNSLLPGSYTLVETNPSGYTSTKDTNGTNDDQIAVTLLSGATSTGNDFLDYLPASISGIVWEDTNGDGSKQSGEGTLLSGVTVRLYTDPNGDGDPSDGVLLDTKTTNASGAYSFTNLTAGNYVVIETDPAGYTSTTANSLKRTLTAGGSATANFGDLYISSSLGSGTIQGTVINDLNGDGVQDTGELPINGVVVTLYDANGNQVGTPFTTGSDGKYSFSGLPPGRYRVVETDPGGYGSTTLNNVDVYLSGSQTLTVDYLDQTGTANIADPAVTKSGSPEAASVGDQVVYTITVGNTGDLTATAVVLTDTKPDFIDILSVLINPNPGLTPVYSGNTFTINFGDVDPGDFYTVTVVTRINSLGQPPGGSNTVALSTTSTATDRSANNNASAGLTVRASNSGGGTGDAAIPETGFAPGRLTMLPPQPSDTLYANADMFLEIPDMNVLVPVVGVPVNKHS